MTILFLVKAALIILIACTLLVFFKDYLQAAREGRLEKTNFISLGIVGFITNFFDTLGIGSFAPTTAIGLPAGKLALAAGVTFILGALATIGVGFYAPCMALVFALGMSPRVAFPIMMSSCAFLMPAASIRFIKEGAYDRKASLAIALFGSVAVFLAAYIVKSLPLHTLKWLVIAVIVFTAGMMFRSALEKAKNLKR